MVDLIQELIESLRRNKLRTALTGISVSVGIFLLIVLLGAGNGLIHAFESNAGNMAMDVMQVWPGQTSEPYQGFKSGRAIKFDDRDINAIKKSFPDRVKEVLATSSTTSSSLRHGKEETTGTLTGVYPDNASVSKISLLNGRYINAIDMKQRRKVIVLDKGTTLQLFGDIGAAVGKTLIIDSCVYKLVGVSSDKNTFGQMQAHVPFTTLRDIYHKGTDIEQITIRLNGVNTTEEDSLFQDDLRRTLGQLHQFSPTDASAIWTYNTSVGAAESNKAMGMLRTSLWVVGLLTLLSGVVGISNIMLITVKERTQEFGIRKALGARPWTILRSVMLESICITAFFGYFGLVAGVAATEYMNVISGQATVDLGDFHMVVFLNPTVDIRVALQALAVLIVSGLIAGFFPARKAVRVKPIEALRG